MEELNRMRHMIPVLVCAALLAACGKKKEEKPPAPTPGPEKVVAPMKGPLASCDALLPKPMRDELFAGQTMMPTGPQKTAAGTILTCMFGKPGPEQQLVQINCSNIAMNSIDGEMKEVKGRMTDVKDIAGLGHAAFTGKENGKTVLHFVDDDTRCYGLLLGPMGNAEAVAKALIAELTPDNTNLKQ
jgi:hypothetical protein